MERTSAVIEEGIARGLHPGAQLCVIHRGRLVVDRAFGLARDGSAMSNQTPTLWMSAGKPVTAVAVLRLVERGALRFEDRVARFMPDFAQGGKQGVTLEHILTHTAGYRGPLNNFTPGTWDEIVARVNALRLEPGWVPGEKAGYHIGSSWFTLGELVRVVDGRSIDRFVRDEVFEPLEERAYVGMSDAEFDAIGPAMARMFLTEQGKMSDDWPGNERGATTVPRPGANARGPIRTLAKLYDSLLHDDRLLTSLRSVATGARRVGMVDQTFKQTLDWGLGFMIDSKRYAGEHAYGFGPHASAKAFGHSGNQSSCAFADPAHELAVAWTCNGMPGEAAHQARASAINAAIYDDLGLRSAPTST